MKKENRAKKKMNFKNRVKKKGTMIGVENGHEKKRGK